MVMTLSDDRVRGSSGERYGGDQELKLNLMVKSYG